MVKLTNWSLENRVLKLCFDIPFYDIELQLMCAKLNTPKNHPQEWMVEGVRYQFSQAQSTIEVCLPESMHLPIMVLVQGGNKGELVPVGFMLNTRVFELKNENVFAEWKRK